jgi:hypothetical protein
MYFIDINLSLVLDSNHKFHMARDGDIFLFTTLSHQDRYFGNSFTSLGMVVGNTQHSNFHQGFKVVMLEKPGNIKFGCFLTNVSDTINIWNTLEAYDKKQVCSGIDYILKLNELVSSVQQILALFSSCRTVVLIHFLFCRPALIAIYATMNLEGLIPHQTIWISLGHNLVLQSLYLCQYNARTSILSKC